jgi:hypothetical protein
MYKKTIDKYLINNFVGGAEYNDSTYIGFLKIKDGGVKVVQGGEDNKIIKSRDYVLKELSGGLKKNTLPLTRFPEYFSALEGKYVRNVMCGSGSSGCVEARKRVKKITEQTIKGGMKQYGDKVKNVFEINAPILYKKLKHNFKYRGGVAGEDNWNAFWKSSSIKMNEVRELAKNLYNNDKKPTREYKEELKKYLKDNDIERRAFIEGYKFLNKSENDIPILVASIDLEYKKIKEDTKKDNPFCNRGNCELAKKRFTQILNDINNKKMYEIYAKNLLEDKLLGGMSEEQKNELKYVESINDSLEGQEECIPPKKLDGWVGVDMDSQAVGVKCPDAVEWVNRQTNQTLTWSMGDREPTNYEITHPEQGIIGSRSRSGGGESDNLTKYYNEMDGGQIIPNRFEILNQII